MDDIRILRFVDIHLLESHFIYLKWKTVKQFPSHEEIVEFVDVGLDMVNHQPFVVLTDLRDVYTLLDPRSKIYVAKHKELNELKIAEAILVNSMHIKLLVQGYIAYFKPKLKPEVFTNEEEARKWLGKFLVK